MPALAGSRTHTLIRGRVVLRAVRTAADKAALPKGQSHVSYDFTLSFNGATTDVSVGVLDDVSKEYGVRTIELPIYDEPDGTEDESPQAK
jgi:hypothetical protein